MAEAKVKLSVSVETVVHDMVSHCLQSIYDNTGIVVGSVQAEWLHLDTMSENRATVTRLNLSTSRAVPHTPTQGEFK